MNKHSAFAAAWLALLLTSACTASDIDTADESSSAADSTSGAEDLAGGSSSSGYEDPLSWPNCGNGVVDDGEECEWGTEACDVDNFTCVWRRYMFTSTERRAGHAWNRDTADLVCRAEAKAAGLPAWASYRAFMGRGVRGPRQDWSPLRAEWRRTCDDAPIPGWYNPADLGPIPLDAWPACDSTGAPTPATPDVTFGELPLQAAWTFVDQLGTGEKECRAGKEIGNAGAFNGPHPLLGGYWVSCDVVLPVLCAGTADSE